jgi:hypothetical protein
MRRYVKTSVTQLGRLIAASLFLALMTIPVSPLVCAQREAALNGIVSDATGAGIQGATVKIKSLEKGTQRDVEMDAAGRYHAPLLPVGQYEVVADKPGFRSERRSGISPVVGQWEDSI